MIDAENHKATQRMNWVEPKDDPMGTLGLSEVHRRLESGRDLFLGFLRRRLPNPLDAEDVFQDFSVRVVRNEGQLRDAGRMDAWLYATLRSALSDHHRKTYRDDLLLKALASESQSPAAERSMEGHMMRRICDCFALLLPRLRPDEAALIHALELEDRPRSEHARALGITENALRTRLHRARRSLRDVLLSHCGVGLRRGFEDCGCEQ